MESKTVFCLVLLFLSIVFAITSVATPAWVVSEFSGTTRLGLTNICINFKYSDNEFCNRMVMSSYWAVMLAFIIIGIGLTLLMFVWSLLSIYGRSSEKFIRIFGFFAMLFYCIACIIFPFGFEIEEIGGQAYKLPAYTKVGFSYYLFCAAIGFLTFSVSLSNVDALRTNLRQG